MLDLSINKRLILLGSAILIGSLVFSSVSFAAVPTFSFSGSGLGHGVGMSQEGAMGMAKAGKNATTIMATYYAGTTLSTKTLSHRVLVNLDPSKSAHSSWTIRPGYDGSYFTIAGRTTKFPDDKYTFSVSSGKMIMTSASGKTAKTTFSGSSVTIVPASHSGADLNQVSNASGPFNYANTRYRGNLVLKISGTRLLLINSLDMQDYLYGVVPREMPYRYAASSQAQAIAARSYAYQSVANGTTLYCNTYSQMYAGHSYFRSEIDRENGDDYLFESASSNVAVGATKDKYVTSNGSVVRAYFAACNGDYTANITDVWGSNSLTYWSTAKTSVKDYYCESMHPGVNGGHHNWTKSYTGLTLANQLKAKGISCPSGAGTTVYVTKFTPTYGTHGWVKKVIVTWSTGQTTTVATCADNVRIKLGFSSAQFTVKTTVPVVTRRYEDGSSAIRRVGSWTRRVIAGNSAGAIRTTSSKGAYFTMRFTGSGVTWVGPRSSSYGRAKVYIDGTYKKTVDLKTSTTYRQQALYRITGLSKSKTHTIKVVITTKPGSSSYGYIGLDRIDVLDGSAVYPASHTYQESSSTMHFSSGWAHVSNSHYSGGSARKTTSLSKTLTTKFKAQSAKIYGTVCTGGGRVKVYVGGTYRKTITLKSSSTGYKVLLYSTSCWDPTIAHTLKLVTTTKSGSHSAGTVIIDKIIVADGSLVK